MDDKAAWRRLEARVLEYRARFWRRVRVLLLGFGACLAVPIGVLALGLSELAFGALLLGLLGLIGLAIYVLVTSRGFTQRFGVLCPHCGNNLGSVGGPFRYGMGSFYSTQCFRCKSEMETA